LPKHRRRGQERGDQSSTGQDRKEQDIAGQTGQTKSGNRSGQHIKVPVY